MNRMFVTVSFQNGENKEEIARLCSLVRDAGFNDFCFIRDIEHYEQVFDSPSELMKRALEEIRKSDYLLLDMTDKPTGRAIEAGIAYTLGVKIVVIMKRGTVIKDAVRGIAESVIEYDHLQDIVPPLRELVR